MKPYTIIDCDQRSDHWKLARAGRITSTCADAILAKGKKAGEESVQRRDLRLRLCCEKLTGQPIDDGGYTNRWMERGVDLESDAFIAYEAEKGVLVRRTGFLTHNTQPIGCSLDGDVDDCVGVVELKCPKTATHVGYLRDPRVPTDYLRQLTHHLLVTGAEWADFVSFDPLLPAAGQLVIRRVTRADVDLAGYQLALDLFLKEVDAEVESLAKLLAERAA